MGWPREFAIGMALVVGLSGCAETRSTSQAPSGTKQAVSAEQEHGHSHEGEHTHLPGAHGGTIVEIGRDSYHCEPVLKGNGELFIHMLQSDETKILEVEQQTLTAFVRNSEGAEQLEFELKPAPASGDSPGKTSVFAGTLPESHRSGSVSVTIQSIRIDGERFRVGFDLAGGHEAMPGKVSNEAARELYLTAGGLYTAADIAANGNMTAAEKFKDFMAAHDMNPKPGDKICPVTATKANQQCAWVVGGKTYEFCCPPCVDEFVTWAKNQPEKVQDPGEYVKK